MVVFLSKFFIKIIITFWDMCSPICPKIFAKLDYFTTVSQMGVAYFSLKILWAFLTFSQICLAYPVLNILENWKKKHTFFRAKDNLVVLPSGQRFSGHNILIIVTKKKSSYIVLCKTGMKCFQDVYLLSYALF